MPSWAWGQSTALKIQNHLDARFVVVDYTYEEPGLMEITGRLSGVSLDYKIPTFSGRSFLLLGGQYLAGLTYYSGRYQFSDDRTPVLQENDRTHTLKIAYGYEYKTAKQNHFEFTAGFARRFHKNNNAQYDRMQIYLYVPVQVAMSFPLGSKSKVKLAYEHDVFLSGENTTRASDLDPNMNDRVYKQNEGSGSKVSLGYETKKFGPVILAQLYIQSWEVSQSDIVKATYKDGTSVSRNGREVYYFEPENTTRIMGFSLGSRF